MVVSTVVLPSQPLAMYSPLWHPLGLHEEQMVLLVVEPEQGTRMYCPAAHFVKQAEQTPSFKDRFLKDTQASKEPL